MQLNAVLEHIEMTDSQSVLSVLKTRYQNKLELLPVLLVQQEQFLMKNGRSVVMYPFETTEFFHNEVDINLSDKEKELICIEY